MKVWYDTEFHERGPEYPIDLISIGMVREDGEELYLINGDADYDAAYRNSWLHDNVLSHLPGIEGTKWLLDWADPAVAPRPELAMYVSSFLRVPDLQLWAWFASYDHVVLAQMFGTMMDLPDHIPMFTLDLKQEANRLRAPSLPEQPAGEEHSAIADARHLRLRANWLRTWAVERGKEPYC